jgi:hypothetical protein
MARIMDTWRPLTFDVTSVALVARPEDGPFEVDRVVRLGG